MSDVGGTIRVVGSTISNNTSVRAGGGIEDNSGSSPLSYLIGVTLTNNTTGSAPGNGGGLHITGAANYSIIGGLVDGNTAISEGGGLWNGSGAMTIDGTTISNNTANGAASDQAS